MGYTIEYKGQFTLNKPLSSFMAMYLRAFSKTRHFRRDVEGLGTEGEFYLDPHERFFYALDFADKNITLSHEKFQEEMKKAGVIDYNNVPSSVPALWCDWIPTDDNKGIKWSGSEKFYEGQEWLKYIIKNILEPEGYVLNGTVEVFDDGCREYDEEHCWLDVLNNNVSVIYEEQ